MMQGYVNDNYEAVISLVIRNGNKLKQIKAVIDTGFTGFLTLPANIINELDLLWKYRDRGTLGDDSETLFDVYEGNVIWDGEYREIEINEAETEPLLGMMILRGYQLRIDNIKNGLVIIEKFTDC